MKINIKGKKNCRNCFKQPRGHCSNECPPIGDYSLLTMERAESVSNEPRNETICEKKLEEVSRRDAGHFYQLRGKQTHDLLEKRFLLFHTNTCPSITELPISPEGNQIWVSQGSLHDIQWVFSKQGTINLLRKKLRHLPSHSCPHCLISKHIFKVFPTKS